MKREYRKSSVAGGSNVPWPESNASSGWKGDSTSTDRTSNTCKSMRDDY